jgi:hypothetical protein
MKLASCQLQGGNVDISHMKKIRHLPIVLIVAAIAMCALPQIASAQPTITDEEENPLGDGTQITAVSHDFVITRWTGVTMECKTVTFHTELADAEEDPILLRQSEEGASPEFESCSVGKSGQERTPMGITPYEEVPWGPIKLFSDGTGSFEMWVNLNFTNGTCVEGLWMRWVSFTSNTSFLNADGELDEDQCMYFGTPVSLHNLQLSHEGGEVILHQ